MAYAELRRADGTKDDCPTFDVFSEPWRARPFSGPPERNWDGFSASEDTASYSWRGGPDILADLAAGVVEGRVTLAQAASNERVSWWFDYIVGNRPHELGLDEDEDARALSSEEICRRLLDAIRAGSIDIDTYDGKSSYYFFEWTNYVYDAAHALELPEWAHREDVDGGGPGSSYEGWRIVLVPGKTLEDLQSWLYDPTRPGGPKPARRKSRRRSR
jgi:hypothetical protein